MKIKFEDLYAGGAYWRVEHDNGKIDYILGFDNIKKLIELAREKIELEASLGFEEHSKLIKLLKSRK